MSLGTTLILLLAVLSLIFGLAVALKGLQTRRRAGFSLLMLILLLFAIGRVVDIVSGTGTLGRFSCIAAVFLPAGISFTLFSLLNFGTYKQHRNMLIATLSGGLLFTILLFTPLAKYLALYICAWLASSAALSMLLYFLWHHMNFASSLTQSFCRLFGFGTLVAFVAVLLLCSPVGDAVWAVAAVVLCLYCYIMFYAVQSSILIDLHHQLANGLFICTLALVISLIYSLCMLWAGVSFGNWFLYAVLASIVTVLSFERFRPTLEKGFYKFLFPTMFAQKNKINDLVLQFDEINDVQLLQKQICQAVVDLQLAASASFYGNLLKQRAFGIQAFTGSKMVDNIDVATFPTVLSEIWERQAIIDISSLQKKAEMLTIHATDDLHIIKEQEQLNKLLTEMQQLEAQIIIPLLTEDEVIGLVLVKNDIDRSKSMNSELVAAFARICAAAMEKCQARENRYLQYAAGIMADFVRKSDLAASIDLTDSSRLLKDIIVPTAAAEEQVKYNLSAVTNKLSCPVQLVKALMAVALNDVPSQLGTTDVQVSSQYSANLQQIIIRFEYSLSRPLEQKLASIVLTAMAPLLPLMQQKAITMESESLVGMVILTIIVPTKEVFE